MMLRGEVLEHHLVGSALGGDKELGPLEMGLEAHGGPDPACGSQILSGLDIALRYRSPVMPC